VKKVILLGAPGSGKGTLALNLKNKWEVPHISTGDMFRDAVSAGSPMGLKASEYMKKGALVPDDVTVGVVAERFNNSDIKKGFILDGFPRTINQAKSLDEILSQINQSLDAVILLNVDENLVVNRITGRRTCSKCGAIYHINNMPSKVENICDKCGGELIQRKDDNEEVVRDRLSAYNKQTAPLIEFYRNKKLLLEIDASKTPSFMLEQVEALSI
jgi:adenylate kinase